MSSPPNFRSISPTFLVKSSVDKSPRFVFVSICNPRDIRDPKKQKVIRRHARRDVERNNRSKKQLEFFRSAYIAEPAAEPIMRTQTAALLQVKEQGTQEHQQHVVGRIFNDDQASSATLQHASLDFLRPIGAGQGFNPFAPLPIKTTPRTAQLLDYRMAPSPSCAYQFTEFRSTI
jgi:hypothetical protein